MALRNSRNNSKAIVGDKSQLSRHTSALTQKSRLGGLKSSGQNRIVTGVEELRIKQENIDKVMMNKMHQENQPGARSRQSQLDTHQSSNAYHRKMISQNVGKTDLLEGNISSLPGFVRQQQLGRVSS